MFAICHNFCATSAPSCTATPSTRFCRCRELVHDRGNRGKVAFGPVRSRCCASRWDRMPRHNRRGFVSTTSVRASMLRPSGSGGRRGRAGRRRSTPSHRPLVGCRFSTCVSGFVSDRVTHVVEIPGAVSRVRLRRACRDDGERGSRDGRGSQRGDSRDALSHRTFLSGRDYSPECRPTSARSAERAAAHVSSPALRPEGATHHCARPHASLACPWATRRS